MVKPTNSMVCVTECYSNAVSYNNIITSSQSSIHIDHRLTAMLWGRLGTKDILDLFSTAVARQWNKATCTLHQTVNITS